MPNQDHICIAITKSNMGGAQKYVVTLAQELQKLGKKVTVLSGGDGILFKQLEEKNIPFIKLTQSQRDISILKEFKLAKELYKIFKQIKPTVLHLNSSKLGGIGAFVGRIAGIKNIFYTAHGWAFNESRPQWQKKLIYILSWVSIILSTKTICVSKQTLNQISFLPFIKNKLIVIYNGIQIPDFLSSEDARNELSKKFTYLDKNKKWFLILAELHYTKGHDLFFEAIKDMRDSLENYQIICVGSGELEGKLKATIHHKNLEKYVFFTGFIENASRYLKGFELLILPSRTEALPLSILESGLGQVPVIASNVGGIPEIITDGENGFLFEKENIKDLKDKLNIFISITDDDKKILTNNLCQKISKDFSLKEMVEQTIAVYGFVF